MGQILQQLGELILKALPTFILLILLHFYLKYIFFRPLSKVLKARQDATEGARRLAEESLAKASEKADEYEAALKAARGDIYREQEESRNKLRQEQAQAVQEARRNADAMVKEASRQIEAEVSAAKETLRRDSDALAARIVEQILHRRPA